MTPKTATKIVLSLLGAIILFHVSILLKIVPYEHTWGGRLKSDSEMYVFETISIVINLLLCWLLLIKGEYLKAIIPIKVVNVLLWVFVVIFGLNTIGNLLAKTNFEKCFAVLTLGFTWLIWVILRRGGKRD